MRPNFFLSIPFAITLFFVSYCNRNTASPNSLKSNSIIIQNYYYAKPGKEEEVLQWRIHACEVLEEIGVPAGRVVKCLNLKMNDVTPRDEPDVIAIVEYPDTASLNKASRLIASSNKFRAIEKHMDSLLRDFNRVVGVVQK